jgi:hypothetical protein
MREPGLVLMNVVAAIYGVTNVTSPRHRSETVSARCVYANCGAYVHVGENVTHHAIGNGDLTLAVCACQRVPAHCP